MYIVKKKPYVGDPLKALKRKQGTAATNARLSIGLDWIGFPTKLLLWEISSMRQYKYSESWMIVSICLFYHHYLKYPTLF